MTLIHWLAPVAPHLGVSLADLAPGSFTAEELLAEATACGVGRAVLIGHDVFHAFDNSYMVDAARRYPAAFRVCALIDDKAPDPEATMRELLMKGVTGFRIDPFFKGKEMLAGGRRCGAPCHTPCPAAARTLACAGSDAFTGSSSDCCIDCWIGLTSVDGSALLLASAEPTGWKGPGWQRCGRRVPRPDRRCVA